ncbi:MAG: NADH-quinone oxidoreductase subunit L [Nitriliruptorales bacterium]|nr:NADH-quinone oxidoreductase subunit L [Nitriliruptorales bacterium]
MTGGVTGMVLAAEGGGAVMSEVTTVTSGVLGLSWLIPLLPLVGSVVILAFGRRFLKERSAYVAQGMAIASFVLSVLVFLEVRGSHATFVRELFTWIEAGPFVVEASLLIDELTSVMLLVVTGVGSLIHIYSYGYMYGDQRFERFFAYLNFFLFAMLVLVLGADLLVLFVGWELVGLASYLLIGFWFEKTDYAVAAKKAFITNRVGDVSFMVAMFLTFATVGSLSFLEVLPAAGELGQTTALVIALLLMGGAAAKSAQIPLYVWLPDAMAGPTPVSALIHAATMVTAGVYLMARTSPILIQSTTAMTIIAWIGVLTALLAALIAIRQDDIKKILAYSTISQLGYMFVGIGTGGFSEGIFHLMTHAFFKALLFLAAGSVMHAMANRTDAWKMGGLRHVMPVTFWTSAVAWLAISGIPPFAGFFSKDQILTTAYEHGFVGVWLLGVVVAVLTAFYMSRWFFLIFLGERRWEPGETVVDDHAVFSASGSGAPGGGGAPPEDRTGPRPSAKDAPTTTLHPHESPGSMTAPLVVLAVLSVVGGFVNFTHHGAFWTFLQPAVADGAAPFEGAHGALSEPVLIAISVIAGLTGIALAYAAYLRKPIRSKRTSEPVRGWFGDLMERKFLVDEAYESVFVRFGGVVADAAVWIDEHIVDGAVNGAATVSARAADWSRRMQTGFARGYIASFVAGAVILFAVLLYQVV